MHVKNLFITILALLVSHWISPSAKADSAQTSENLAICESEIPPRLDPLNYKLISYILCNKSPYEMEGRPSKLVIPESTWNKIRRSKAHKALLTQNGINLRNIKTFLPKASETEHAIYSWTRWEDRFTIKNSIIEGDLDLSFSEFERGIHLEDLTITGTLILDRAKVKGFAFFKNVAANAISLTRLTTHDDLTFENLNVTFKNPSSNKPSKRSLIFKNGLVGGRLKITNSKAFSQYETQTPHTIKLDGMTVRGPFKLFDRKFNDIKIKDSAFSDNIYVNRTIQKIPPDFYLMSSRTLTYDSCLPQTFDDTDLASINVDRTNVAKKINIQSILPLHIRIYKNKIGDDLLISDCYSLLRQNFFRAKTPSKKQYIHSSPINHLNIADTIISGSIDLSTLTLGATARLENVQAQGDLLLIKERRSYEGEANKFTKIQSGDGLRHFSLRRFSAFGLRDRSDIWFGMQRKYTLRGMTIDNLPELVGQSVELEPFSLDDFFEKRLYWLRKQSGARQQHYVDNYLMLGTLFSVNGSPSYMKDALYQSGLRELETTARGIFDEEVNLKKLTTVLYLSYRWLVDGFGQKIFRPIIIILLLFFGFFTLTFRNIHSLGGGIQSTLLFCLENTFPKLDLGSNIAVVRLTKRCQIITSVYRLTLTGLAAAVAIAHSGVL
jgi:hypothetical protein